MDVSAFRPVGRFIFGKLLPRGLPLPVITGSLRGLRLVLGSIAGDGGGGSAYFGMYETEQTKCIASVIRKGDTFIDLGANVGYYSLLASRIVGPSGKVISVEPMLGNALMLQKHLNLNGVSNVTILPLAICDVAELALFTVGFNNAMGTLSTYSREERRQLLVPTATLDGLVNALKLEPHVIKVDVEGAEASVLEGARATLREFRPIIFLSTHSEGLTSDCLARLEGLCYQIEPLNGTRQNATEYLARPST